VRCGNCPDGHKAEAALLKKYPGQLFAINIHAGNYAVPIEKSDPDMNITKGTTLNALFKIPGYPAAVLNRHKFGTSYNMDVKYSRETEWGNYMEQVFAMDSYVNIAAKGELDWATRKLKLTVQLYYTRDVPSGTTNCIHVAMTQDEIIAQQLGSSVNPDQVTTDGRYRHLHVLRDILTPFEGDIVTSIGKGSLITRTYEWALPEEIKEIPLDLLDTHFVVFVAESQYEIFSACEPEIKHLNAPESVVSISDAKSLPSYSCDLAGRASFTFANKLGKDISEVTFSLQTSWGNTEYTYKTEPVLKAGESGRVLTDAFAARPNGEESVEIKVKEVNGEAYAADALSTATAAISALYAFTHNADVTLNIVQDRYGSDITWNFRDTEKETVLYTGGPYRDMNTSGKINSTPMNLEKGCYVLTVYDKSGDGINNKSGAGNINFVSQGKEFYRHDGKYADSVVIMLDTRENAANGKTEKTETLTLRPNPAKDRAEISFTAEKTAMVRVQVLNHTGACVLDLGNVHTEAGNARIELPLQNLVPGLYFVTLRGENVNLSSKLVIVR
ncbi:MAG: Omp28-related outer membrane protein, partial [Bacteroidales bacterium]|nr:Omp28-related outer membrane protein [Bacteroidales bacterium]